MRRDVGGARPQRAGRDADQHARRGPGLPARALNAADAHLSRVDPVLAQEIAAHGPLPADHRADDPRAPGRDHYGALVRTIAGQQLSVKAARAIYARLTDRFGGRPPTPQEVLDDDPEELRRAAGFSRAKVSYLRSLAELVVAGELHLDRLDELTDDEVIAELTRVKGIGLWSAQMLLMFHLARPDVLPLGDLGIRNAFVRLYGLDEKPSEEAMTTIAEPWRPYRSRACLYLWRSLDNAPAV